MWHYDYTEREQWEQDTGYIPKPPAKTGRSRAGEILALGLSHGIKGTTVSTKLSYADTVAGAGAAVGWSRAGARARWREASGFAHGRTWSLLRLSSPEDAEPIRGGVGVLMTLEERHLAELARLTHDVLVGAVTRYAELSDDVAD